VKWSGFPSTLEDGQFYKSSDFPDPETLALLIAYGTDCGLEVTKIKDTQLIEALKQLRPSLFTD
jgi:hypothetical protein